LPVPVHVAPELEVPKLQMQWRDVKSSTYPTNKDTDIAIRHSVTYAMEQKRLNRTWSIFVAVRRNITCRALDPFRSDPLA
jgi:hypothetical protein